MSHVPMKGLKLAMQNCDTVFLLLTAESFCRCSCQQNLIHLCYILNVFNMRRGRTFTFKLSCNQCLCLSPTNKPSTFLSQITVASFCQGYFACQYNSVKSSFKISIKPCLAKTLFQLSPFSHRICPKLIDYMH